MWEATGYNSRLQPAETYQAIDNQPTQMLWYSCLNWGEQPNFGGALFQLCPSSRTGNDNGNLQSAGYTHGGAQPVQFNEYFWYDNVNRLLAANGKDAGNNLLWAQNFQYDAYGNGWLAGSGGYTVASETPTTNQYTAANQIAGAFYDAAGNQIVNSAAYDGENRIISVKDPATLGGATETIAYDGLGHRVQKIKPDGTIVYVYDAFDRLVAEYAPDSPTAPPCQTCYLSTHHLRSTRLVTHENASVVARHDFLPFGEELKNGTAGRTEKFGASDNVPQRFTGKERDTESGLDYFGARYYGSALGRWTSPDRINLTSARLLNPTNTLNKYIYDGNNPLK